MSRARNIQDEDVAKIVEILDGWTGKLSWKLLLDAIEKRLSVRYTRQALHKYTRITHAFRHRKDALANDDVQPRRKNLSPELKLALDRIDRLTAENKRLEAENLRLLEQFTRWVYNANTRGLDDAFLNRSLPSIDRGATGGRPVGMRAGRK